MGKRGERIGWDVLTQPGLNVRSSLLSRHLEILHRSEEKKINMGQKYVFLEKIMRGKITFNIYFYKAAKYENITIIIIKSKLSNYQQKIYP